MRCSHLMMLIVVLPVLLSSLEIQLAEGIKCYVCSSCNGKGEESDCVATSDRCAESKQLMPPLNKTRIDRFCSDKDTEDHAKEIGTLCDAFRPVVAGSSTFSKQCFCYADLCNDMLGDSPTSPGTSNNASLITGFSTLLLPLIVSSSAFFLFKGFFQ